MEALLQVIKPLVQNLAAQWREHLPNYVWPLSNSAIPDPLNTSYGPRINTDRWDFHDGIDIPAPRGTKVHAVRGGTVAHASEAGKDGFSSRHVVLKSEDPTDGILYHIYLHLQEIAPSIRKGAKVEQGREIGRVGRDGAHYEHLHLEFRSGSLQPTASVHPLRYLPYPDTANFTAPAADRFNRVDGLMAARLLFGTASRLEGDLRKVEVELRQGPLVLATRIADFHDGATIRKERGNGDEYLFTGDIGVEGYQKSDLAGDRRDDLRYGILVRNIPEACDRLVARVFDLRDRVVSSSEIPVPDQTGVNQYLDFESAAFPPPGWHVLTSESGSGTKVARIGTYAGYAGQEVSLLCVDASSSETASQRAGIEYDLPSGRFQWTAEAWFNPAELDLAFGQSVYLLHFLANEALSVAARIHNDGGRITAGIAARGPDGKARGSRGTVPVECNVWRRWRLDVLRIGTRETTAVLYVGDGDQLIEAARLNWNTDARNEPRSFRAGLGYSSAGARAVVLVDHLRLSESMAAPESFSEDSA